MKELRNINSQFSIFIKKEFFHIFRDKRTILILLVMPVIQIILFGFAITTEVKNTKMAIFDLSKDFSTRTITEHFRASNYFSIVQTIQNPDEIEDLLKKGEVSLVLIFSEQFEKNLIHIGEASIQLLADASEPNQASTLTGYATNIILRYQQELMNSRQIPYQINTEVRMLYNSQMKSAYNFVPGVMGLILMLICAMMTSISIVREKEMGTMEVLLASPVKPIYIILAKAVPYFILSVINLSTILLLSVFVLKVPIAGNLFLLSMVSFIFIMVALALGLLISTVVNSQVAAMLISGMAMMLPVMLLSGMIFPIESMPKFFQWFSAIVPARWYIAAVKKIMIQGVDVIYVVKEILILSFMAVFLIAVSLKKFKIRLS